MLIQRITFNKEHNECLFMQHLNAFQSNTRFLLIGSVFVEKYKYILERNLGNGNGGNFHGDLQSTKRWIIEG